MPSPAWTAVKGHETRRSGAAPREQSQPVSDVCGRSRPGQACHDASPGGRPPRTGRNDRQLCTPPQLQLVASLEDDGSRSSTGTDRGTNGGALAASTDRADDGADGCTDGAPFNGLRGLAVVLYCPAALHMERLAAGRPDGLEVPAKGYDRPSRIRMVSKVKVISARPLSRSDAFALDTVPSMMAPSYGDGLRVVMVKRSSA